jgi:hypothetical protein
MNFYLMIYNQAKDNRGNHNMKVGCHSVKYGFKKLKSKRMQKSKINEPAKSKLNL